MMGAGSNPALGTKQTALGGAEMDITQRDIDRIKAGCDDLKNEIDELGDRLLDEQTERRHLVDEIDRLQAEVDRLSEGVEP